MNQIKTLAKNLVNYSCNLKDNENILIEYNGEASTPLIKEIIKEIYNSGGNPFVQKKDDSILREILLGAKDNQLEILKKLKLEEIKKMDAYISVNSSDNAFTLSDVPQNKINLYNKKMLEVLNYRVDKTKWVILRYPNNALSQLANMSLENFTDFFFKVCNLDYKKMSLAMDNLVNIMNNTDKVKILGKNTNLEFSIKGIPSIKCDGKCNIPDGEVYTAPIKDSINGYITYNTPSLEDGFTYEDIYFEIKNGKIIKATCNNSKKLNEILDTDEGSRYFGEFAIGVNPYILEPMKDTLFDEKIAGSFHLTPGMCYDDAPNGNASAVHWDLVNIQRPEYGGGEIYFDDKLIREDGLFCIKPLECLNPENLV